MKSNKGITVVYIRSDEIYDYYMVTGNGIHETINRIRNSGDTEESILEEYND